MGNRSKKIRFKRRYTNGQCENTMFIITIKERQIKSTKICYFISTRRAKIKRTKDAGKDVEKRETAHTAIMKSCVEVSENIKNRNKTW